VAETILSASQEFLKEENAVKSHHSLKEYLTLSHTNQKRLSTETGMERQKKAIKI